MTPPRVVNGPKGLLSYPVQFIDYCRDPLAHMTRMAQRYGDIVRLSLFGMRFYMFNHPDEIEEILRHKHRLFKKDFYVKALEPLIGTGLLTSDGEPWRRQRMMAQPAFGAKQIEQYSATMVDFTERLTSKWRPGETRDIHADMMRLTSEIVTKTLFDAPMGDAAESIGEDLETAMAYYANPLSMWPSWRHVPTPANLRFARTLRKLKTVVFKMIAERRAAGPEDRTDLLSRLLVSRDEQGGRMSDSELCDQLMTLFLAGHETTALTLSYSFYCLAKNPETQFLLDAELDRVLGERPPTVGDVPELRYSEWVIKESMRLYPPAWTIGREALEDCEIGGCKVGKGSQVLMAQWIVQRDPRFWPEPERFNPSRWGEASTKNTPRCAYFPFGDGPRICIGNTFAMMEAVLLLATIAQRWRLELPPEYTLQLVPTVTLRPRDGIPMVVQRRQPKRVIAAEADTAQPAFAAR
jgi:cytochrome P450